MALFIVLLSVRHRPRSDPDGVVRAGHLALALPIGARADRGRRASVTQRTCDNPYEHMSVRLWQVGPFGARREHNRHAMSGVYCDGCTAMSDPPRRWVLSQTSTTYTRRSRTWMRDRCASASRWALWGTVVVLCVACMLVFATRTAAVAGSRLLNDQVTPPLSPGPWLACLLSV